MNPHSPVRIAIHHTLLRHCSKTGSSHGRRPGLSIQENPPQSFGEGSGPKERETDARIGVLAGVPPEPRESILPASGDVWRGTLSTNESEVSETYETA
jgi:hypothetical protein